MLLALDAGNTNVTIGVFDGERIVTRWRLRTDRDQTADEWGILMRNLFTLEGLDLAQVDGFIVSSVVPIIDEPLKADGAALLPDRGDVRRRGDRHRPGESVR